MSKDSSSTEPDIIELDAAHLEANGIVGLDKKDRRARAFNLLRTQLMKRIAGTGKFVGITSAMPGAGKSLTAVNLAVSLAKLSRWPVALVDLDFRRGSVASYLGLRPEVGLAAVLEGTAELDAISVRAIHPNLTIYPAVPADESGSLLLTSKAFDDLLATIRETIGEGIAIFDLPPVFADDDAMIATQKLDGYLFMVDAGVTPAGQVTHSIERLSPATCFGTVLNRYEGGLFDSYGYDYKYGYNY